MEFVVVTMERWNEITASCEAQRQQNLAERQG